MDFSNITQEQWLIIGGAALIVLILGWLIGYLPGRGARKQLEARVAEVETKLKSTSQNLADAQAQAQSLQSASPTPAPTWPMPRTNCPRSRSIIRRCRMRRPHARPRWPISART